MQIVDYTNKHFAGVDSLWRECFPDDPPRNQAAFAIPAKLALGDDLLLIAEGNEGRVIGTVMAGYDGHRGWLYAVAVDPQMRRQGVGARLIEAACERLRQRGCGKVNLQIRAGNTDVEAYYASLGFVTEERISMGREL